jgi:hypothetical protein
VGGPVAESGHCAGPTAAGTGSDTHGVGSVERITGAVVGEGCSKVAHVGEGSPCDDGGNGGGVRSISHGAGGGVSCCSNRAGEGDVLWRGEPRRSSPSSLSSSASHCLFTAFFIRLAGGGREPVKSLVARARAASARVVKAQTVRARAWEMAILLMMVEVH